MKKIIATDKAPAAFGPFSKGPPENVFFFTTGQLAIDPKSVDLAPGVIADKTRQSLLNLKAVLEAGGSSLSKVLKTTVFLSDMNNFAEMNKVYSEIFGAEEHPGRSAVEVARLPKDGLIEIEAIALA